MLRWIGAASRLALGAAFGLIASVALAQSSVGDGMSRPADEADRGATLFRASCGFCHGAEGGGAQGPNLTVSRFFIADDRGGLLGDFLKIGRPGSGMPAFATLAPGDTAAKAALGYCLMAQGRISESERVCREVSSTDPLIVAVWYNLGRLAVGAGRFQEAEGILRKALEVQPQAARIHSHFATLDILRNNPTGAMEHAQAEPDGFWHDFAVTLALQAGNDKSKTRFVHIKKAAR